MNMEATTLRTRYKPKLSLNSVVGSSDSMFLRRIHVEDNHSLGGNHERFILFIDE